MPIDRSVEYVLRCNQCGLVYATSIVNRCAENARDQAKAIGWFVNNSGRYVLCANCKYARDNQASKGD